MFVILKWSSTSTIEDFDLQNISTENVEINEHFYI